MDESEGRKRTEDRGRGVRVFTDGGDGPERGEDRGRGVRTLTDEGVGPEEDEAQVKLEPRFNSASGPRQRWADLHAFELRPDCTVGGRGVGRGLQPTVVRVFPPTSPQLPPSRDLTSTGNRVYWTRWRPQSVRRPIFHPQGSLRGGSSLPVGLRIPDPTTWSYP